MDSTFQSLEKITPKSFFSLENPLILALLLIAIIMLVTYIYYRYVIIPMRKKHLQEQENLKLQQAELMALFAELAPDPIFRFDENGKIVLANNSAHNIFPHKILVGEHVEVVLPFIKSFDIQDLISHNKTVNYTTLLGDKYYQFLIASVPKFKMCQVYGRDITDLKKTERDLKIALEKAEESKKLKEFFLSQISHEIRSPLNVITGYSDLLMQELHDKSSEYNDILRSIINNSKRLYRTFDLMLNMSQLQTGKYEARFERINLLAMMSTIVNEFRTFADEKNLKLNLINRLEEDNTITADHYSIAQIFINLLDNAIKYTPHGKVEILLYRDHNNVCVDVRDTGIGISKEYQEKLFTPFSQADMSYTRPYEGTGLGLALVKIFIDLNRAKIKVNSEPGGGTTFTIILSGDKKWGIQK
ncbi:MAG: PAS domain-containing sensor histidine kinase [Ignavibacteria bacterium]|nr:PAS domain-containing sensor histidine kinase [Ignavibacteria bacterium]